MAAKKYSVMLTKEEVNIITSVMDAYINSHMKNHYTANELSSMTKLNLELKCRITEIDEEESFESIIDKGLLK